MWAAVATAMLLLSACPTDPVGVNNPPEIRLDVPTTFDYVVGEGRLTITVTAEDPDGHAVEVGVVDKPPRATMQPFNGWAVFDWDPLASDVTPADQPLNLVFYAEDELGARSERVVSVLIRAGNGVPRFENSPSVLYNTDSNKPLIFEVRVRDDDSTRIALSMPTARAPVGASFIPASNGFSGVFEWMPDEQQREFRVHSVTFTADDGQNPTVTQKVSILFQKSGSGTEETRPEVPDNPADPTNCAYEDQVRHAPLGSQRGTADYRIEAMLAGEAANRYDRLVLNWSHEDVYNNYDVQLEGKEMTNENGTFVATIPNPLLPAGESREYYYEICAIDDDSSDDDSVLCGPSTMYHSFIAYSPNDTICIDDAFANGSFETALDLDGVVGWEHHRICESPDDYYRIDLDPFQDADVFFTYPFGSPTTVEMFDQDRNPLPVDASACAGFTYIYVENQADASKTRYFRVSGRDAPYQVSPYYFSPTSTCVPTDIEPNDTAGTAALLPTDGTQTELQEICNASDVDVFRFPVTEGQTITANSTFTHADGDLDMKLFAPSRMADVAVNTSATASALSVTDNERITHVARETGTYYLLMRGYQQGNTYRIGVLVEDPPEECVDDDSFGDNHTEATAAQATAFTNHVNLDVCPGTDDWYSFVGFAGEFIDVVVKVTSGDASALTVTVHLDGSPAQAGVRSGDTITASVDVVANVTYHLQVATTEPVIYELSIHPMFL